MTITSTELSGDPSVPCDARLRAVLHDAIEEEGFPARDLASGAGHDAAALARLCPVAMLFLRCEGGISHNPAENVDELDVAIALDVMEHALLRPGSPAMSEVVQITSGGFSFAGRLERERAPRTCEAFERLLPYEQRVIHVRWSGESCWIPLGEFDLGVPFEERHELSGAGGAAVVSRRHLGDRAAVPVRQLLLRVEGGPARRQPLPDDHAGDRTAPRARREDALGGAQPIRFERA